MFTYRVLSEFLKERVNDPSLAGSSSVPPRVSLAFQAQVLQTKDPKQKIPSLSSQAKVPKLKLPSRSS